jgi:aspartate aminotransferase
MKEPRIARKAKTRGTSAVIRTTAAFKELTERGVDCVNFCLGEPDLDAPSHVTEAVGRALAQGKTRYVDVTGSIELRSAAARWINEGHGLDVGSEQIIVCVGAKHTLFNLFQAFLDEGDEVIVPTPCWGNHLWLIVEGGGKPVLTPTDAENGFALDPEAIERAITPRTKGLLVSNPANPTGAVCSKDAAHAIARICARHGVVVITDDVYRSLTYDAEYCSLAGAARAEGAPFALVDGVSKMYRMTGFRVGFGVSDKSLIRAMANIQGNVLTCPPAPCEAAALAALTGPQQSVQEMRDEYRRRWQAATEGLRTLPRVRFKTPRGAFFLLADMRGWLGAVTPNGKLIANDDDIAEFLLEEARVAVNPGGSFHAEGFLRIVYAGTPVPRIEEGIKRIQSALSRLVI